MIPAADMRLTFVAMLEAFDRRDLDGMMALMPEARDGVVCLLGMFIGLTGSLIEFPGQFDISSWAEKIRAEVAAGG